LRDDATALGDGDGLAVAVYFVKELKEVSLGLGCGDWRAL
jgi:hypothetical protein